MNPDYRELAAYGLALYERVRDDVRSGRVTRSDAFTHLDGLHEQMGADGREGEQDAIAEVLDALTGFCSPTAAI